MELTKKLPEKLLRWYDSSHRSLPWRDQPIPYYVWVSEIMLQQTRVEAVRPYFDRFIAALPDVFALANAKEETLLKLWEGLGYYRRVHYLQRAAKEVVDRYGGVIPSAYEQLRAMPGIGDYTAGAIASIAYGAPRAAVDGNVLRVITRLCGDFRDIGSLSVKREITAALEQVYPIGRCGDFTQSLMELGATVCLPNGAPHCKECPLHEDCIAYLQNCADELPVKKPKKERQVFSYLVLILKRDGKIAIRKRTAEGLLHRLWELPNRADIEGTAAAKTYAEELGVMPKSVQCGRSAKHIFTHVEWRMTSYIVTCGAAGDKSLCWVTPKELEENYGLPSAFRHFSAAWQEKD